MHISFAILQITVSTFSSSELFHNVGTVYVLLFSIDLTRLIDLDNQIPEDTLALHHK
jgi:hypothetical protein